GLTSSPTKPYFALCRNTVRREYSRRIPWLAQARHLQTGILDNQEILRHFRDSVFFPMSEADEGDVSEVASLTSADFQSKDFH
ncbi:hypothetical protein U2446_15205, partial [Listeria monocytogenes]|uniref:hypothetical protein n=1 Tax=Listeria monocytogenes TaxID=1639 RepID=UPI002FDBCB13